MPRRARAPRGGGGGEEVKAEDFVDSVLNFGGGGGESDDGEQLPEAEAGTEYKSKNLVAERRRRGRLNGNILALRAVVPKITKASDYLLLTLIMQKTIIRYGPFQFP
ncbi:hypothetical protein ABZP36_000462 [Zizania latifolia]